MSPSHRSDPVETETTSSWIENGILISEVKDNAEIQLEDAKKVTEAFRKLSGDKLYPLMVVFGNIKYQSREARNYFSSDPTHIETYSAVAIVVENPLSKIIANFFLGLNKPKRPTRLFNDRSEALNWLEQHK